MKSLSFLLALSYLANIALGFTDEELALVLKDKDACIQETGVDPELIEKAKQGTFEDDEKLACFASCIMQKLGIMDADLTIHRDVAVQVIPSTISREKAEMVMDKCKNISGNNACLKGGLILKCILQHKDELTSK